MAQASVPVDELIALCVPEAFVELVNAVSPETRREIIDLVNAQLAEIGWILQPVEQEGDMGVKN